MVDRVYIASKVKHAKRWRDMRRFIDCDIVSSWIDIEGTPDYEKMWRYMIIPDIRKADRLILYTKPGEIHKGSLVEVGIALARGISIYIVSEASAIYPNKEDDSWPIGSWVNHPNVFVVPTLADAFVGQMKEESKERT